MKVTLLKKQSKKEQRKLHARKRRDWNGLKPTTRVVKSKKVYDRKKLSKPEEEWERSMKYLDCISVENMRESDHVTIEKYVSGRTLMYRAAMGVFRAVNWHGEIVIAVGGGNNGGDGYALACILKRNDYTCRIVKLSEKLTEDSGYYAKQTESLGVTCEVYESGAFAEADIIVDCLLGTGFQGTLREPWLGAVQEINSSKAEVVSVDINSGMNGDTGEAETAVRSDITVTIGYVKRGLVSPNAARYMQKLVVADIGIVLAREEEKIVPANADIQSDDGCIPAPDYLIMEPIDVSHEDLFFSLKNSRINVIMDLL